MEIPAKIYKGRLILGSEQYGDSSANNPELILDINIKLDDGNTKRVSTALYFSQAAAEYSYDRLRAAGWKGTSAADLVNMAGIDENEVDVEISYEMYPPPPAPDSKQRMRVQIMSGGGRFAPSKPVDKAAFAAKVAALTGSKAPPPPSNAPQPKF